MSKTKSKQSASALSHSWRGYLSSPIDAASLAVFRICFGAAVAYDLLMFLFPESKDFKFIFEIPDWNFPYPGFEWVVALSPFVVKLIFGIGGVAALLFALGLFTRVAALLMFLGYTYFFLIDSAHFNNHYYLICIFAFWSIWMPCDKRFSLRLPAIKANGKNTWLVCFLYRCGLIRSSSTNSHLIPRWPVFLLRSQLLIVYLYGAIAKLNADWFTGEPIIGSAEIFEKQVEMIFPFMSGVEPITYAITMAWIGLIFDFAIGFLLMIPRTQLLGIGLLACFHGINQLTLPIGVFPFLGFTASFIFLAPDWPLQFGQWLRKPRFIKPDWSWLGWGSLIIPGLGALLGWKLKQTKATQASNISLHVTSPMIVFVSAWILLQAVIPLRHFTIDGDPSWTEEGQFFSWRMMLRQKSAGNLTLHLHDPAMFVEDSQERRIDWNTLPGLKERALYIPIDASRFNWAENQGLNRIYEGIVGYRLVQAVKATTPEGIELEREELENWWQLKTGQHLVIKESQPFENCLNNIGQHLSKIESDYEFEDIKSAKTRLEEICQVYDHSKTLSPALRSQSIAKIHDYFAYLSKFEFYEAIIQELKLAHPFSIIGVEPPINQRFWILAQRDDSSQLQDLCDSLGRGTDYLIWCDFGRLRFHEWSGLPEWMPVFESGRLTIMWNYFEELSLKQIQQISIRPHLIWQYVQRMANIWEDEYGRRPEIYCHGTVMMNYRYPAPLIDPTVDLAAAKYSFLHHNEWIMPFKSERIGISNRLHKNQ